MCVLYVGRYSTNKQACLLPTHVLTEWRVGAAVIVNACAISTNQMLSARSLAARYSMLADMQVVAWEVDIEAYGSACGLL